MDGQCLFFLGVLIVVLLLWLWTSYTREQERQKEILAHRLEWSDQICEMLIKKQISINLTKQQVMLAWGKPNYTDQSEVTQKGKKVRWVYGTPRRDARYVWFTENRVTKIKRT